MLHRLAEAGLITESDGDISPTRKWSARLHAAAEAINLAISKTGVTPQGNPLMLAASKALHELAFGDEDFDDAVRMLVLLELSRMSATNREKMGFGGLLD